MVLGGGNRVFGPGGLGDTGIGASDTGLSGSRLFPGQLSKCMSLRKSSLVTHMTVPSSLFIATYAPIRLRTFFFF